MNNDTTKQNGNSVKEVALERVPLDKIEVLENVRKHFEPGAMKELAESIRHNGILVPLVLAKNGKPGVHILIDGERRFRAAKIVGLLDAPARIVEVDQAKIVELQLLTTLHRADLGPIEEARGFKKLLDAGTHTIEALAQQVDKTVGYVTKSVRLLELPRKAVTAIEKGELSPAHGHQLLRVPEDRREALVTFALNKDWRGQLPTVGALADQIRQRVERDLKRANFPKDKEYAGKIACTGCAFNSGNQDVLFAGAEEGSCLNGGCFASKEAFYMKEFREKSAKKFDGLKCVGMASGNYGDTPRQIKGAAVLSEEEAGSAKVKALLARSPEKFGFGVVKASRWGSKTPKAVLVCQDPELLSAQIRKARSTDEPVMTPEERERENFLDAAETKALYAEAARSLKAIKKKHLVAILLTMNLTDESCEAVGLPQTDNIEAALGKLTEKDLLRLAWLSSLDGHNLDEEVKQVGLAPAKVRKDARKAALAEWEKAQATTAEPTKDEEVSATA